jgi:hypothetical protein
MSIHPVATIFGAAVPVAMTATINSLQLERKEGRKKVNGYFCNFCLVEKKVLPSLIFDCNMSERRRIII